MTTFSIELVINEKLYQKDPQRSEIGRRILKHSVLLLDEIGLERFTFKRLAERIESTEATVYRYFASKHMLLLYLTNWYWEWMKVHIDYATQNIESPVEKLRRAIKAIVDTAKRNTRVEFIDEDILHRIVMVEGIKAYHSKEVDEQNREGFFLAYKSLSGQLSEIIRELNPEFPYPRALATNLLEMANNHIYFSEHLPRLTEVKSGPDTLEQVEKLLDFYALRILGVEPTQEDTYQAAEPREEAGDERRRHSAEYPAPSYRGSGARSKELPRQSGPVHKFGTRDKIHF